MGLAWGHPASTENSLYGLDLTPGFGQQIGQADLVEQRPATGHRLFEHRLELATAIESAGVYCLVKTRHQVDIGFGVVQDLAKQERVSRYRQSGQCIKT
jgi:hypothetical protein